MYHYLVGTYTNQHLEVSNQSPSAGHVQAIQDLVLNISINSHDESITSCVLSCGANPQMDLSDCSELTKNGLVNVDFKSLDQESKNITFNLTLQTESGKLYQVATIVFTEMMAVPKVILVVGAPRSGTTAVGNAVQKAFGVTSHGESHIAELIQQLVEFAANHVQSSPAALNEGTLLNATNSVEIEAEILTMLRSLHRRYYGEKVIIDKTPGMPMLVALPYLMKAYPNARVIFCRRRGLENIRSRMSKFPEEQFSNHCNQWSQSFESWREAVNHVKLIVKHDDWYLPIEQYELASNVDTQVERMASFLDLSEAQKKEMLGYLHHHSPEQSSTDQVTLDITTINWNEEQKQIFHSICDDEMVLQGYSMDESHYLAK